VEAQDRAGSILGLNALTVCGSARDMQRLRSSGYDVVHQHVIQEARKRLEMTREAINAFIASQWDHAPTGEPSTTCSNSVRGG